MLTVDASDIYNVGTGVAESFETVAQAIAKKYDAKIVYIPVSYTHLTLPTTPYV